ncbi:hypothetical protein Aperf_G00000020601 [Anoplocephala perfoliata]
MDTKEFNKRTKKLCLSRRNLFKGTPFDQLYNRYLDHRSLLPTLLETSDSSASDVLVNYGGDFLRDPQTFTCRFCKVCVSARTAIHETPSGFLTPKPKAPQVSPAEFFNLSTASSQRSGKKSRKKKVKELMKEVYVQQASATKRRQSYRRMSMDKRALRKRMKRILARIPVSIRLSKSQLLTQKLLAHEFYRTCRGISVYISFSNEPSTDLLIQHALETGKVVVVPQILRQTVESTFFKLTSLLGCMRMRRLHSSEEITTWPLNQFGIREMPQPSSDEDRDDALTNLVDLIVVPGLAFTKSGDRLGRGGGFYDRYLAGLRRFYQTSHPELPPPRTIALAFSEQIVDAINTEEHDAKIDAAISV